MAHYLISLAAVTVVGCTVEALLLIRLRKKYTNGQSIRRYIQEHTWVKKEDLDSERQR